MVGKASKRRKSDDFFRASQKFLHRARTHRNGCFVFVFVFVFVFGFGFVFVFVFVFGFRFRFRFCHKISETMRRRGRFVRVLRTFYVFFSFTVLCVIIGIVGDSSSPPSSPSSHPSVGRARGNYSVDTRIRGTHSRTHPFSHFFLFSVDVIDVIDPKRSCTVRMLLTESVVFLVMALRATRPFTRNSMVYSIFHEYWLVLFHWVVLQGTHCTRWQEIGIHLMICAIVFRVAWTVARTYFPGRREYDVPYDYDDTDPYDVGATMRRERMRILRRRRGLDEEYRKKLRTEVAKKDMGEVCPVCFDAILKGQVVTTLPCGHVFHSQSQCIGGWFCRSHTCPVCRLDCKAALDATSLEAPETEKTEHVDVDVDAPS